ncbi:MAG: hypothetical protein DBX05_03350 [Candidatus Poseidoniales archaeon]|nr:MAG: hypothetical protein DBX05_03350 [Candidatus Poseidoniales archaeon]|tara:strand:+ start:5153 stop:6772 length:1620 start_codon:yes stop_codon:yes gene_type:complete
MVGASGQQRRVLSLLLIIVFCVPLLLSGTQAQGDDPRILSHERNTLYFYGNNDAGGASTSWEMWNHAQASDTDSDDSVSESNAFVPGDPNNGGGTREFTFDGKVSNSNVTEINQDVTITGTLRLNIFCQQGSCSKDVTVYLRKGGVDTTSITISPENEGGDVYVFEFFHNIKEVKSGETIGLRIQFTKPSGVGDGYELHLGQNNFQMDIPVIAPDTSDIDGVLLADGTNWETPYADAGVGFQSQTSSTVGIFLPVFLGIILLAGAICGIVFTPGMPAITAAAVLTCVSLMGPAVVAPIAAYMDVSDHSDVDMDPNVYSVDQFAALEASSGSFLTDFRAGDEFGIWVPLDGREVYSKSIQHNGRDAVLWGLGHQEHNEILGNPEVTTVAGREAVQLYFSSIIQYTDGAECEGQDPNATDTIAGEDFDPCDEFDLTKSAGVMIRVVLAQDGDSIRPINNVNITLTDGSPRNAIIWTDAEPMGMPPSWNMYSMAGIIPALGCLGFGIYTLMKERRGPVSDDKEEDFYDDDDFDDDFIDDLEI